MATKFAPGSERPIPARGAGLPRRRLPRRGISTLWLLLFLPVLLILVGIVVNVGNLWVARVEVENGLEAAALAAVKEWGDTAGTTEIPRLVGIEYAAANCVRGRPLHLCTNLDLAPGPNNPNANLTCCVGREDPCEGVPPAGNLIFGAVTTDDPDCPITFDAGVEPGCGGQGTVLFDVWGNRNLAQDNCWGIAFIRTEDTPDDLRIKTVIINLRAGGKDGRFISAPVLSSNAPGQWVVRDGAGGHSQADIVGFTDYVINGSSGQIQFTPNYLGNDYLLRIDFFPDPDGSGGYLDDGFEPCDRIRFGIDVEDVSKGKFGDDADGIGADHVGITVVFEQGPVDGPVTTVTRYGTYANSRNRFCRDEASYWELCSNNVTDPPGLPGDLIVAPNGLPPPPAQFPDGVPNLPCPAASGEQYNTGQSWTLVSAGGGEGTYAVRAQAMVPVRSPWTGILGVDCGCKYVFASVTAIYDCQTRSPRLVRVDKFICPGPEEEEEEP